MEKTLKEKQHEYYIKNRDRIRKQQSDYVSKNIEKRRAQWRAYRKAQHL